MRGGNTHYSGGLLRFAYDRAEDLLPLVPDVERGARIHRGNRAVSAQAVSRGSDRVTRAAPIRSCREILIGRIPTTPCAGWPRRASRWSRASRSARARRQHDQVVAGRDRSARAMRASGCRGCGSRPRRSAASRSATARSAVRLSRTQRAASRGVAVRDGDGHSRADGARGRARLRRLRGQSRVARAATRTPVGPRQGARHPLQHRATACAWRSRSAPCRGASGAAATRRRSTPRRRLTATAS